MGHDIYGINKGGEEIAYARFSMGNPNALILFNFLDAYKYYSGVSGTGEEATYSLQQIEKSWKRLKENNNNHSFNPDDQSMDWDEKQIYNFIYNCLLTAQKEGSIRLYFG
ncbi:hypothetical protein [Paucisalibacillus sp. EB02]|uniref:hypothetical protein n=1 Tax=Paucisalibacillus sp. EB02 TaxID=1347087 RepID=UPI0004BB3316|nr:hypothetical protein [Paucisalibacillus sp. EB02]